MKFKSLFFSVLCMLMIGVSFTACSDDDDESNRNDEGSKTELPQNRVYILNEGAYQKNNAGITLYDPDGKVPTISDLFYTQNSAKLGDAGQDMIEYNGNIYVTMYGSKYITRLNSAGVEQARYSFTEEQGQPRYMVAEDDKIYVTLYSGNVARLDATTLAFEKMVKVGNNPEYIIEEDGKLYCLNSGWGYDNRLSIIDINTFNEAENIEIFQNPERILEVGDKIIIQGYGDAYPNYTYPVAIFNPDTKSYKEIGQGTHIAGYKNTLYIIYSATNWDTNTTTNTFYSYNTSNGEVNENSFLKSVPEKLASSSIYMFNINPANGDIYIGISDFNTNDDVYRFNNNGSLIGTFESGVSSRKAVFLN
ncbi:YncE family protein [Phocaeicola sp.]